MLDIIHRIDKYQNQNFKEIYRVELKKDKGHKWKIYSVLREAEAPEPGGEG